MAEILESLSYKVKFSTEEIMPLLEQKINSVMGEEYVIDFFITNAVGSDALEVSYYAFPKKIKDALSDSYLKMAFIHEGILYTYTKKMQNVEFTKMILHTAMLLKIIILKIYY